MSEADFPHRLVTIGEPLHAHADGERIVVSSPAPPHVSDVDDASPFVRKYLEASIVARRARDMRLFGERIGPAEAAADPASITDPARPAAKLSPVIGPSVHLFDPLRGCCP